MDFFGVSIAYCFTCCFLALSWALFMWSLSHGFVLFLTMLNAFFLCHSVFLHTFFLLIGMLHFLYLCSSINLIPISGLSFMWKAASDVEVLNTYFLHCILRFYQKQKKRDLDKYYFVSLKTLLLFFISEKTSELLRQGHRMRKRFNTMKNAFNNNTVAKMCNFH